MEYAKLNDQQTVSYTPNVVPIQPIAVQQQQAYQSTPTVNVQLGVPQMQASNLSNPSSPQNMPAFDTLCDQPHELKFKSITYSETMTGGVASDDKELNDNSTILAFIKGQATVPHLFIHQEAWHYETRFRTVTRRDSNGNEYCDTETYEEKVVDLCRSTDITRYVTPFYTLHNLDSIDRYLTSNNKLRKITVRKYVNNALVRLCSAVYALNRYKFRHYEVDVRLNNDKIQVFPDEDFSKCIRSPITDVLCVLTCMCIFFYPVKYCYEQDFKCDMVFALGAAEEQIYMENFLSFIA